ncbi:rRNA maturation RNase YbeY [Candidatus Peregrinibacteria bacterium]|nr:rRNA maturation RNase YbeY [Candidatus Peregrinibacteria bacterium]
MAPIVLHYSNTTSSPIQKSIFKKLLTRTLEVLSKDRSFETSPFSGVLEVTIVNDAAICNINKNHRHKNYPTDVISLSFLEGMAFPGKKKILGEIYISVDTARKQAKKQGYSLEQELHILFVHGLLHILGYDHEHGKKDAQKMAKKEQQILHGIKGLIAD